ncbi:Restriction endonuclease [compost metagenome]
MSSRRKKKDAGLVEGGSTLLIFASFFWIFNQTKSIGVALLAAVFVLLLVLIVLTTIRMLKEERLKRSGIKEIDKMTGRQFEQYLGLLFKGYGYSVKVTKLSGDYGADLVLTKNGKRIVVQAKRYSKNVGIQAVQEAQASIAHYKATEAWVVTNSNYTPAAYELAKSNQVRLVGRDELIDMILRLKNKKAS